MKRNQVILLLAILLVGSGYCAAQAWSGILNSTRAINWSTAGVPGGIPSRSVCTTISPSTYGNGASDATAGIQAALNSCAANEAVMLSAGTYLINGTVAVPANVTLRGAGADQTILSAKSGSGTAVVTLGTGSPNFGQAVSITGGTAQGSTSITVSSASGISVGSYLVIDQLNDNSIVTIAGSEGSCTWCDGGEASGTRAQGQVVEVTSVSGATIGISPGLFAAYTLTPHATPFTATKYAGLENLQIYANNTGRATNFAMEACAYCWISGVEGNYTDGDHVEVDWSYHSEVVNSYFSNAYLHTPGSYDSDCVLRNKSTGVLVQNNIFERLHVSMMLEWGAAGNVVAYNYALGAFDSGATSVVMGDIDLHGAHPQYNLFEGNVVTSYGADSTWGSHANNTFFRNSLIGTSKGCAPYSGRGTVSCSGSNGIQQTQAVRAVNLTYLSTYANLVGNVVGSTAMQALKPYSQVEPEVYQVIAVCPSGVSTNCGSGSRGYDSTVYDYSIGYGETSDDGSSGYDALAPYTTMFRHGDYSGATASTAWATGVTQTLPASFYLSGKPAWWGSVPYPVIGPDVTGGPGLAGHVYAIPAQNCYTGAMKGTDSSNSPLTFNAATCYGGSTGSGSGTAVVAPVVTGCSVCTGSSCSSTNCSIQAQ